jgi:mono/diheme cytochrome c family protein
MRLRKEYWIAAAAILLPACQQQMSKQPYFRPLEESAFFADGRSARPMVLGTVPRGKALPGSPLVSGQRTAEARQAAELIAAVPQPMSATAQAAATTFPSFVDEFPFAIKAADLARGRERYLIFCAVCHDPLGTGKGSIVERGYLQPPNYYTDDSRGYARRGIKMPLRDAPVGYYFQVITDGFGAMPDYRSQVPAADRWRIVAYIRALQFSQRAPLDQLPQAERAEALRQLEAK